MIFRNIVHVYNTSGISVYLQGTDTKTTIKINEQRIHTMETKFLNATRGYAEADKVRNATIRVELNVEPLEENGQRYKEKLGIRLVLHRKNVNRMLNCCVGISLKVIIV